MHGLTGSRYMMNGGQQIVGGLLAYCFSLLGNDKAIKSWQALFLAYGGISVLYGIVLLIMMPDSPMRAKCFTEEDKHLMVERVRSNRTGLQNRKFRPYQVKEALLDPQLWCYCLIQIFTTLPTSGLGAFANIVITSLNFTVLETQLLAMVLGFYIIIVLMSSAWLVNKTGQNTLVMAGYLILFVPPFSLPGPSEKHHRADQSLQLLRRNYRPNDRRKQKQGHPGRPADQLLPDTLVLVRADPGSVHGFAQHRRPDQEDRRRRRDFYLMGCRECRRYVPFFFFFPPSPPPGSL